MDDHTLREAFSHKLLKDVRIFICEASFYLGNLQTEIRIKLYKIPTNEFSVYFELSHHLHTPLQTSVKSTSDIYASSEEEAFYEAVSRLTDAYESAVMAGHKPSAEWLVVNEYF